jgi:uncharacterized membrane protein
VAIVIGTFEDYAQAQATVQDLIAAGFSSEVISVVGRRGGTPDGAPSHEADTSGTAMGIGTGAVIGGALAAMGLAVPGIGFVLAAGPLAAALAGASIGAAAGGVMGALVDLGVPTDEAHEYAEAVGRGATLVTVTVDESMSERAVEIMNRHHPVEVEERAEGSPEDADTTVTTEDLRRERDRLRAPSWGARVRLYGARTADDDYRRHHATTFGGSGQRYEDAAEAYAFGRDLATNPHYGTVDWTLMEPEARRQWEERHPGTWDGVRDAIRYGWEQRRHRQAA